MFILALQINVMLNMGYSSSQRHEHILAIYFLLVVLCFGKYLLNY